MVTQDIERLKYTIQNGNRTNSNDADALNNIIGYVNTEKERQCVRNDLFFKLAINILKQDIIKSGGNDKLAMSNLRSLCNIDLDDTLERFVTEVNQMEITEAKGDIELEDALLNHPKWEEESFKKKIITVLSRFLD